MAHLFCSTLIFVVNQLTGLNVEMQELLLCVCGHIYLIVLTLMYITGIGAYFGAQCEKHGMLVRVAGDNIMICPPLIISSEEVDEVTSQTNFCSYLSISKIKLLLISGHFVPYDTKMPALNLPFIIS